MKHPTPEQIAHMQAHIEDDRRGWLIGANVAFLVLAMISIVMRFMARKKIGARIGVDDWLICLAAICIVGHASAVLATLQFGMGRHIIIASNPKGFGIANMVAMTFYNVSLTCTKLSILALYARIFRRTIGWLTPSLWVFATFVLCLGIAAPFVYILQCLPIRSLWTEMPPDVQVRCLNFPLAILIIGVINIITDWMLLLLPIPVVIGLKLDKRTKWTICSLFMVGGTVCIISIVRLDFAKNVDMVDPSYDNVPIGALSTIEGSAGILAACMPTWRPLFRFLGGGLSSLWGSGNKKSGSRSNNLSYGHSSNAAGRPRGPYVDVEAQDRSRGLRVPGSDMEKHPSSRLPSPSGTRGPWRQRNESSASGDSVEKMLQGRSREKEESIELVTVETKSVGSRMTPSPSPPPIPVIAVLDPVVVKSRPKSTMAPPVRDETFTSYDPVTSYTAKAEADSWPMPHEPQHYGPGTGRERDVAGGWRTGRDGIMITKTITSSEEEALGLRR